MPAHRIVPILALSALAALCGCAPSKLAVQSIKDEGRAYPQAPLHVIIQETKETERFLKGMDTVATAVFKAAGLPADIAYNGYLALENASVQSLRKAGSAGYALIIAIPQVAYVNLFPETLIFQTEMFDLSDGKKTWKCVANMSGRMGYMPGQGQREYLEAMLQRAASDQVIRAAK